MLDETETHQAIAQTQSSLWAKYLISVASDFLRIEIAGFHSHCLRHYLLAKDSLINS